ncbi:hypothetical protein DVS28_a2916 [Euzebya pacifica]|uniref:Uncharacterized protein n=1 Tax=Euzebya pacifica TaxID=1608957 RepID=A0A346XZE8_9ACTN|nr:hypothetical protein DVS28_a2916 [Euzebya pacifica]
MRIGDHTNPASPVGATCTGVRTVSLPTERHASPRRPPLYDSPGVDDVGAAHSWDADRWH